MQNKCERPIASASLSFFIQFNMWTIIGLQFTRPLSVDCDKFDESWQFEARLCWALIGRAIQFYWHPWLKSRLTRFILSLYRYWAIEELIYEINQYWMWNFSVLWMALEIRWTVMFVIQCILLYQVTCLLQEKWRMVKLIIKDFKVQSHYSVWHQRMRAYTHTLAYAHKRWCSLGVR